MGMGNINGKAIIMTQDQYNITGMQGTVADYLNQNQPVWSGLKAVKDNVAALVANNEIISTKADGQEHATDGAGEMKRQARHDLEEKILEIADQLFALADKNHDVTLEAQTHFTISSLDGLDDDRLERTAKDISALATANLAALADYGITQAEITALDTQASVFTGVKTAPRSAVAMRSGQTKSLSQAIDDNQSLLRRQLDKQMTRFKKASPEFYAGYQAARVIINRRSHHKTSETATAPAAPTASAA